MKIRRESVRSSRRSSRSPRFSAVKEFRASRKASPRQATKRVPQTATRGVSRVAQAARDNPGKSLVILGMIAIVAIVTVVVLVLPPPSMEVDISDLLGEQNVAGQAIYTIQPGKMYPVSLDSGSGADTYRSAIK